ncbi:MAG: 16S rRNA (cytosine(1402)-N(4))-methyltransferase RsmH [Candidatus Omnitrophica bacterium]|nr:16S rRNA (cytosine(1402)-N(4))-methyltransferase RsmH [Candidatus Omnitrophota bacterium]
MHKSVLLSEALENLNCRNGSVVLDCTLGCAGHAVEILKKISPDGMLIGLDADNLAVNKSAEILREFGKNFRLFNENFCCFDKVLASLGIGQVDAVLFDLGISSLQLDDGQRGFSFSNSGPLDMRLDRTKGRPLWEMLETMTENQIGNIIRTFGEERYWRTISRAIVEAGRISPIYDSGRLAAVITNAVGRKYAQRINPATRAFQAFRIFVNDELKSIESALLKVPGFLKKNGRIVAISFHSLEDRIVKHTLRAFAKDGLLRVITKKPIRPREEEIVLNPRARSAKMRSAERI